VSDTEDIAAARRALGKHLARLRTAAGHSQFQLAPLIGYSRSTIATAETGKRIAAREFWQSCDEVLASDGVLTRQYDELNALRSRHHAAVQQATQLKQRARVLCWQLAAIERTDATGPVHGPELEPMTAALDKPWRIGRASLNAVASVLAATRLLEDQTSSRAVLPVVRNLVAIIDVYAREARSEVRPRTLALASELHCYLGWLWFEALRADRRAGADFDAALSLAVEADHPDHLAHAASFKGYVGLKTNRLGQAIALSEAAQRDSRTLPALRVFDGYQTGHAYALAGDARHADQAMLAADRLLEALPDDPLPTWAYWYNIPFLITQRANVHDALGRHDQAVADLEAGLAEMPLEHRDAEWAQDIQQRLAALQAR
jgi:DNA-binding XRE family transcriptional regulator